MAGINISTVVPSIAYESITFTWDDHYNLRGTEIASVSSPYFARFFFSIHICTSYDFVNNIVGRKKIQTSTANLGLKFITFVFWIIVSSSSFRQLSRMLLFHLCHKKNRWGNSISSWESLLDSLNCSISDTWWLISELSASIWLSFSDISTNCFSIHNFCRRATSGSKWPIN